MLIKIWYKVLLFDIIRPKKFLYSVFSRYWGVGWIPIFFLSFCLSWPFSQNFYNPGGSQNFVKKQTMVNVFDKKINTVNPFFNMLFLMDYYNYLDLNITAQFNSSPPPPRSTFKPHWYFDLFPLKCVAIFIRGLHGWPEGGGAYLTISS